jgi:hypothetical protein
LLTQERRRKCLQHPPRIRFERFDRTRGEWVEIDPKRALGNDEWRHARS